MNRKKKINEALKKHQKRKNAKLHRSNKPRYISKADRAKYEEPAKAAGMTIEEYMDSLKDTETEQAAAAEVATSEDAAEKADA
ncbi:hypothetical protein JCM19237_4615 [Photobacterium aphoticum]|uniref:DUF2986 domain-containing protein n=1 Tax=Photobacterium aphoticum TaxID=754436 RepID=A0A090QZA2_9GAMM|nr:hypothetical protein JCM19237_4615 [Photobacterium aphoticum]